MLPTCEPCLTFGRSDRGSGMGKGHGDVVAQAGRGLVVIIPRPTTATGDTISTLESAPARSAPEESATQDALSRLARNKRKGPAYIRPIVSCPEILRERSRSHHRESPLF